MLFSMWRNNIRIYVNLKTLFFSSETKINVMPQIPNSTLLIPHIPERGPANSLYHIPMNKEPSTPHPIHFHDSFPERSIRPLPSIPFRINELILRLAFILNFFQPTSYMRVGHLSDLILHRHDLRTIFLARF